MKPTRSLLFAVLLAACGSTAAVTTTATAPASTAGSGAGTKVEARLSAISDEVTAWQNVPDLATATAHAEAAANLVLGPDGPGYGDLNGDGQVSGANDLGLLPAADGDPQGLVLDAFGPADCVERDVLGGSWDDPAGRWDQLATAIADWSPTNNTFPSLGSHLMRIVGWATLSQNSDLDTVHEFAGHARLHVDVATSAVAGC